MDKPILPVNATHEQIVEWENLMIEWENEQILILKGIYDSTPKKTPKKPTIDDNGYRHVFCVVNSLGYRQYFDNQRDAVALMRNAVNQPCKIFDCPILPRYEWHDTPIETLAPLVDIEFTKVRKRGFLARP